MTSKHVIAIVAIVLIAGAGYLLYKRLGNVRQPPANAQAPNPRSNPITNTLKDILSLGVAGTEAYAQVKTNLNGFSGKKTMAN